MAGIEFTQFMRPNGRPVSVMVERPDPISDKADAIREAGFRFECEVVPGGLVSLTITGGNGDWAQKLVPNGPSVHEAVDAMIQEFDIEKTVKAIAEFDGS